jgi:hypothetical protein
MICAVDTPSGVKTSERIRTLANASSLAPRVRMIVARSA